MAASEAPPPAPAATASEGIQELVVTAQKRAENEQSVPLSIRRLFALEFRAHF